jgi:hypothetical protein
MDHIEQQKRNWCSSVGLPFDQALGLNTSPTLVERQTANLVLGLTEIVLKMTDTTRMLPLQKLAIRRGISDEALKLLTFRAQALRETLNAG